MTRRFLILFILVLTLFAGCKRKYEDGPAVSLKSAKSRLVKTWKFTSYIMDDVDFTQRFSNDDLKFSIDNSATWTAYDSHGNTQKINGTWSLNDDKTELSLIFSTPIAMYSNGLSINIVETCVFSILKLSKKDLWLEGNVTESITDNSFQPITDKMSWKLKS